jgi:hypothetical protein
MLALWLIDYHGYNDFDKELSMNEWKKKFIVVGQVILGIKVVSPTWFLWECVPLWHDFLKVSQ